MRPGATLQEITNASDADIRLPSESRHYPFRFYWGGRKRAGGAPISAHIHQEAQLIVNFSQSSMRIQAGDEEIELAFRQMIFIPPWRQHAIIRSSGNDLDEPQLSVTVPSDILTEIGLSAIDVLPGPHDICQWWLNELQRYAPDGEVTESHEEANGNPLVLLVSALLASLPLALESNSQQETVSSDRRIWQSIEHMSKRSPELPDVRSLARNFGMSRAQFFRRFKATTGVTPVLVMDALRMEYARDALLIKGDDVGSIADELGFSTPSHFARFFRMHTGSSPTEYQRRAYCL